MRTTRLMTGAAIGSAAMLLAAPAVAMADDGGGDAAGVQGDTAWQVHVDSPELTAQEQNGITTVSFAPEGVGDGATCIGPQVVDLAAAQEAGESGIPTSILGRVGWVVENADMFMIPKGFADKNSDLIEDFYPDGYGEGSDDLATAALLYQLLLVGGEPGPGVGNESVGTAEPSNYMERTSTSNAFGYELDADGSYLASAFCGGFDSDDPDTVTSSDGYYTPIGTPIGENLWGGTADNVEGTAVYQPGGTVLVRVTNLQSGETYSFQGNSTPFCELDDVTADEDGTVTVMCTIPEDLPEGTHHFTLSDGSDAVVTIEFKVADDGEASGALKGSAEGTENGEDPGSEDPTGGDDTNGGDNTGGDNTGGGDDTTSGTGSLGSLFGSLGSA